MINLEETVKLTLPANLDELAEQHKVAYRGAEPFPFVVLDNFLPTATAELAAQQFPSAKVAAKEWTQVYNEGIQKKAVGSIEIVSPIAQQIMHLLSSPPMLRFLEKLTGISALLPDPYQIGRGLQISPRGGLLAVHADGNYHEQLKLYRRINLLLYLTPGWEEEFGGHLELWNANMTRCIERILPVFNRCILFSITPTAFHGYPLEITCPPDMTRNLISLVYCTSVAPEDDEHPRGTLWQKRPAEQTELLKASPDYDELSADGAYALLKRYERELALSKRENDSLLLRLGEARENTEILLNYERNMLIHRVGGAEHWVSSMQQQVAELEEKLRLEQEKSLEEDRQLTIELGAAQQWAKELEQQLNVLQNKNILSHLRNYLQKKL